ncbi:MAG: polyprenyl synthetase family protein, partial [Desulfobacterales bacterium]
FQTLSANDTIRNQSPSTWLEVVQAYAFAAGYEGMIEGQMLDTTLEGTQITLKELEQMHALKTGALFNASVYTGAIIGGGTKMQIKNLKTYAIHIGLAFQVSDDILNIEGNPALMGKATGSDAEHQKCTYPSLMGLEQSKEFANQLINSALQALEIFDNRSDSLRAIARYIIERKN